MLIPTNVQKRFNAAAKTYDNESSVQQTIGKNLLNYLTPHLSSTARILDLGCGTGKTTLEVARTLHFTEFHAVDIADQLLTQAHDRLDGLNITAYSADFNHPLPPSKPFHLIFSNMALHWSSCFISTLSHITPCVEKNGLLAFSLPLVGTFQELQTHYSCQLFFTSDFIKEVLSATGYDLLTAQEETHRSSFKDTLSALRSIKNTGATHVAERKNKNLCGKSFLQQTQITQLTYVIGYFIAQRKNIHVHQIIRDRNRHRCRQNLR